MVSEPQLGASQFSGIPDSVRTCQPSRTGEGVSHTLSMSRPEKEAKLMGNCCESKMRLRQDWKKERSRHAFEVVKGMALRKETTLSRPNFHVATRKQIDQ